jgi:hypothetical protein
VVHVVLVILANLLTILVKKGVEIGAILGASLGASLGATLGVERGATLGVERGATLDARLGIKTTAIRGVEKRHLFFSKKNRFVNVPSTENVKNVVIINNI